MLPDGWLDFVFPEGLRKKSDWIDPYGRSRRSYLLGFSQASTAVGRPLIESLFSGRSPAFSEDPRRYIPLKGWRDRFHFHGEHFVPEACHADRHIGGRTYACAPYEPLREPCRKWGSYGKDQPEHAFLKRPMRLFDALKSIAALHDALNQTGLDVEIKASHDGRQHATGELSLHVAIFNVPGFDQAYYETHFETQPALLGELFERCQLHSRLLTQAVPTFAELSHGMSATKRTCETLLAFCAEKGMPPLGQISTEYGPRGRLRGERRAIKRITRKGIFEKYSADCAIEIFVL